MTETRKIRWGVIGATAQIAQKGVIPAILGNPHAELTAVASRSRDSAKEIASASGPGVAAYNDYDSLIADDNVDVVYLPLPNSLHLGWAVEAMNNGKHVLCEKPLALNANEAEEMLETAENNEVVLSEAFMYRYHPLQQEVNTLVREGGLGAVHLVRASYSFVQTDLADYRRDPGMGGGALFDVGCYCLNIARMAFGTEPTAVTAKSIYDPDTGIDTTTTALLEFGTDGMALIDCSFSLTFRASYEIVGSEASISVPRFLLGGLRSGGKPEAGNYKLSYAGETEERVSEAGNMYVGEVEAMTAKLLGKDSVLLSAEDSHRNMKALDAVAASARSGQKMLL
ncbi:MAG: Gfo/Idh/MocA family protein [Janthinobacterium lividum]